MKLHAPMRARAGQLLQLNPQYQTWIKEIFGTGSLIPADAYKAAAVEIARHRIALAGAHLGNLLRAALK
jgi:hypothetical protein